MPKESVTKEVSTGVCSFCKGEFPKSKMTTHLKYCKQRALVDSAETRSSAKSRKPEKTKLFHIVVEGHYNPQYWMHLEMPASAMLSDLDSFLRDIWLECCGHLSAFKIGNVLYSSDAEDVDWDLDELNKSLNELTVAGDSEPKDSSSAGVESKPAGVPLEPLNLFPPNLLSNPGGLLSEEEPDDLFRLLSRELLSAVAERAVQERSLNVELGEVLKAGQKFSHEYDFGSTTELRLRVVAEREGEVHGRKKAIQIMARNVPPVILCKVCGKPATQVVSGYYDAESNGYCSKCARKNEDYEMMLPVVNSPRVGVCGYTG